MKPSERDYILYLEDIVISMNRVQQYILNLDFQHFKWDFKTVDAVLKNFEIIGEASKNLPKNIKETYSHIPWESMYTLRNIITHEYFGIDYEIIWNIATNQLPKNYQDMLIILKIEQDKLLNK